MGPKLRQGILYRNTLPKDSQEALHKNNLLPISNNLEQAECENHVEEVGPSDEPTPASKADNVLLTGKHIYSTRTV